MPELLHTAPIPYVAALGVRTTSDYARMLHMRRNVMQRFTASALQHFRGLYTCAPAMCPCFARLSAWPGPIAPSWCAVRHSQENICPTIVHYNSWNVPVSSLRSIRIRAVKLRQRQHSASAPRCGAHSTNTISSSVTFSIEERTWH